MNKIKHPQDRAERLKIDKQKKSPKAGKASGLRKRIKQVIEDIETKDELEQFTRD